MIQQDINTLNNQIHQINFTYGQIQQLLRLITDSIDKADNLTDSFGSVQWDNVREYKARRAIANDLLTIVREQSIA